MREKLIELLDALGIDDDWYTNGEIADHIIANGVTVQQWIPVTERKPDLELVEVKNQDIDLFPCLVSKVSQGQCRTTVVTKAWWDGLHFMDSDCIYITKYVTHWMPLPEPPKGE